MQFHRVGVRVWVLMQVKCLAQWLGESEDPGNGSEREAEFL